MPAAAPAVVLAGSRAEGRVDAIDTPSRILLALLAPLLVATWVLVPAAPALDAPVRFALLVAGLTFVIHQAMLLRQRTQTLVAVTELTTENERLVAELRTELDRRQSDQLRVIQSSRAAAVGELAAGVAHEVNNPLTGILGFSELLIADLAEDDPRRTDLETIRDEALRARRIVSALRDFAAPARPQLVATDLADLIHRTVELTRYSLERGGAVVHEDLAALPAIQLDGHAIQQAIVSVLTNAGQAIAPCGRIDVRLSRDGNDALISIVDDGVGMDPATADLATEPFFTGRPDEAGVTPARGLGLSIASGLVESHGGTITIDSWPDRGTTVEIRLPLRFDEPATHLAGDAFAATLPAARGDA